LRPPGLLFRPPGEASALLAFAGGRRGKIAFWTAIDEAPATACLGLITAESHVSDTWRILPVDAVLARGSRKTQDVEALARHEGFVYLIGSQYGRPGGPLESRRSFLARFREPSVAGDTVHLEVVRDRLSLHRAINDALAASGIQLIRLAERARRGYIQRSIDIGRKGGKAWAAQVRPGDLPVNVEGATFDPDGTLLLGLRFPVTADGRPIVIELTGTPGRFDRAGPNTVEVPAVHVLGDVGSARWPMAIRDLELCQGELHALVGGIDADLIENGRPPSARPFQHRATAWPPATYAGPLPSRLVRRFQPGQRVEGLAADGRGGFAYVAERLPELDRPARGEVAVVRLSPTERPTSAS
jgi:hypothetical protein